MNIVSTSNLPVSTNAQPKLPDIDTSWLQSAILADLDTNGDGEIAESEFVAYRNRKQAIGQFVPTQTQSNFLGVSSDVHDAIFEILAKQESK